MRYFVWFLIVGTLGIAIYFFWESSYLAKRDQTDLSGEQPLVLDKTKFMEYDKGSLSWWFEADKALSYETADQLLLYHIIGEVYSKKTPQKPAYFEADFGKIDQKKKLTTIQGNIRASLLGGMKLYAEELQIDQVSNQLFSQKKVRLIDEKTDLHAESMNYDLNQAELEFEKVDISFQSH